MLYPDSKRCSDGVTLTGDGVTQAQLPLVDGEQVAGFQKSPYITIDHIVSPLLGGW